MKIHVKRIKNMQIVLFLKVISDMFYQIQFLDILLTGFATVLLIHAAHQRKLKGNICDALIIVMLLLFTVSFLKDVSYFRDYVKIASAFLMYFLGRYYGNDANDISSALSSSYLIAFIVNAVYCVIGDGTIIWGNALTFKGLYYFKTDFTAMIAHFVLFYFIVKEKYILFDYVLLVLAGVFTFLANTRIYYLIFALLVCLILIYKNGQKLVSVKTCTWIVAFALVGVLGVIILPKLPMFADRQLISLNINSIGDLFNSSNTQGRNKIWETVLSAFSDTNVMTQLFGAELSFNDRYGYEGFNEHSLYVKLILNTGYIGLLVWLLFVAIIILVISKERNRKVAFLCCMLLLVYSVAGISSPTIVFTSSSWLPMLYCGLLCSIEKIRLK